MAALHTRMALFGGLGAVGGVVAHALAAGEPWLDAVVRYGAQPIGQVGELQRTPRGDGDGIEELLGTQTTGQGMREVDQVVLVPAVRHDAQLVGP